MPRSGRVPGIFISYRRDDSAGFAGRLYDRLAARFGAEHVFMDIDTITPGHEFAADIERALSACDACIVLIGRRWGSIALPDGRRRLEDPTDFVRLEVAAAIRRGITVFPVLVEGAKPPEPASLPEDIRDVSGRQAIELSNERWNYDVGRLILALEQLGSGGEGPPPKETHRRSMRQPAMIAGGVGVLVIVGLVIAFAVTRGPGGTVAGSPPSGASSNNPPVALAACPVGPPSLEPSADLQLSEMATYTVSLTPACQTGQPGARNNVWTNPRLGSVGSDWPPETWTFAPVDHGVAWTFGRRVQAAMVNPYDPGGYLAVDRTATPMGCATPNPDHVRRALYLSVPRADAESFNGWFVISWTCTGDFEVRFRVTGTKDSP